jgi:hypothetical protein
MMIFSKLKLLSVHSKNKTLVDEHWLREGRWEPLVFGQLSIELMPFSHFAVHALENRLVWALNARLEFELEAGYVRRLCHCLQIEDLCIC